MSALDKTLIDTITTSKTSAFNPPVPAHDSGTQNPANVQTGLTTATLGNYLNVYA